MPSLAGNASASCSAYSKIKIILCYEYISLLAEYSDILTYKHIVAVASGGERSI